MSVDCCAKAVLVIINIFFQVIGAVLFVLGMILRFGWSLIQSFIPIDIQGFLDSLPSITSGAGIDGVTSSTATDTLDVASVLNIIAIVLIVLGLFMFIVGTCGCCGACCTVKVMLILYAVVTLVVFIGELVVIALLYTGVFGDSLQNRLNSTLVESYTGVEDISLDGLIWNVLMISLQCCGINNYRDFDYATQWVKERTFTIDSYTAQLTMVTPVACCKTDGTFPSVTPLDTNCTLTPRDNTSNWNTGCWDEIQSQLESTENIFIGATVGIVVFELACVAVAVFILIRSREKLSPA